MLALLPSAPPVAHPSITRRNTSNTAAPARPLPPSAVASSSSTTRPSSSSITPTPTAPVQPAAPAPPPAQISIHNYPSAELLRLLASLLTQIAQANDKLQAPDSPHPVPSPAALATRPLWHTLTTASRGSLASQTSPLAFHARTVPTISLHAYLARIHKYCPAPNDVFLALLVYFDRMARLSADATGRAFVIDSFNVHRLVIAGVTVASKFFSDVFYTNSRYAKVGGLPQSELNQLELQFLLLNDFRLRVSDDEMQHYADQLVLFSHTNAVPPSPSSLPLALTDAPSSHSSSHHHEHGHHHHHHHPHHPSHLASSSYTPSSSSTASSSTAPFQSPSASTPHVNGTTRPRLAHQASMTSLASETESTDAGGSTDDEPTVRPAYSTASHTDDETDDEEEEEEEDGIGSDGTEGVGSDEEEDAGEGARGGKSAR